MVKKLEQLKVMMKNNRENLILAKDGTNSRICGDKEIESLVNFTAKVVVNEDEKIACILFKDGKLATIRVINLEDTKWIVDQFIELNDSEIFCIDKEEKLVSKEYIDNLIGSGEVISIDSFDLGELTLYLKDGTDKVITYF